MDTKYLKTYKTESQKRKPKIHNTPEETAEKIKNKY